MLLTELNNIINDNTNVKIWLHYGYKNCNPFLKYDCKWIAVKNDKYKEDFIVDSIEPHTDYLYIGVHR